MMARRWWRSDMPQHWRCLDCRALYGGWLSGCPRCRSGRELVVALNECAGCTTLFAVGLPRCPQCRSTDFAEQGQDMPKITEHGGATNAAEPGPDLTVSTGAVIATSGAWADEPEPIDEVETETAEEEPSPGNSSETSSETPSSEPAPSEPPTPSPAPTTASRSKRGRTGSRSARGTAGGQAADTSAADEGVIE